MTLLERLVLAVYATDPSTPWQRPGNHPSMLSC